METEELGGGEVGEQSRMLGGREVRLSSHSGFRVGAWVGGGTFPQTGSLAFGGIIESSILDAFT